ncbi:CASP-like protein 4D1 [Coffea arabica]|uniref:CASP-like protein n=1 Tax=Coffea arabica TaxID=13443 RepID=A0ABM4VKH8_COFAR
MYRAQYDGYYEPCSSKVPIFSLAARVATFASLVVTVVILQTNKATLNTEFRLTYSDTTCLFHSYRYMLYVSILGLVYTVMQIPLAVYYFGARKRLIEHYSLLHIDFYGDKIMSLLLGEGVGATSDLNMAYQTSKLFFDLSYVAAVFILIGCLGSAISSIFSSLALSKDE